MFSAPEGSSYHEPCLEHWVMTCLKHDTIENSKLYETWKYQIRTMVESFPCLKMVKLTIKTGVLRPDLVDIWQPLTCLKNLQELWVHSSRLVKKWVVNSRPPFFHILQRYIPYYYVLLGAGVLKLSYYSGNRSRI